MAKKKQAEVSEEVSVEASSLAPEEVAEKFFDSRPDYPLDSIYVSEDGIVFDGNSQGKNRVENYCSERNIGYTHIKK